MVGGRGSLHVQASQGHPPRRPARPDPLRGRLHRAHREVGAVRDPVGPALDHRHHRHPVGPRQGAPGGQPRRHRLHPRATSTRSCASRSTTRTSRACTPACGRSSPASPSRPRRISREHTVVTPVPGLVMIAGGKLTTYRVMAVDAVDAAGALAQDHGDARSATRSPTGCRWSGADGYETRSNQRVAPRPPRRSARRPDRPPARPLRLPGRRPARAASTPGPTWPPPLEGADDHLEAEIVYAVTHEGARHLDDVLTPPYPDLDRDLRPRRPRRDRRRRG